MNQTPFFFIRTNRKYERIELAELIYVECCRGYLKLVTDSRSWMVHASMANAEQLIPSERFCRIHRSYMVAIDRVQSFDKDHVTIRESGSLKKLPIGQDRYKNALLEKVSAIGEPPVRVVLKAMAVVG